MYDIDVYEYKETLSELPEGYEEWVDVQLDKEVGIVEVGKCPKDINDKLKEIGYKEGDNVLVVIQG